MDHSEWIALSVVGAAFVAYVRGFFKSKSSTCCGKSCALRAAQKIALKHGKI